MNKIIKLLLLVLPLLFLITCIERDNPWDPLYGCPEEIKADYRQNQAFQIEVLRSNALLLSSKIGNFLDTFFINKEDVQRIFYRNDSLKLMVTAKNAFNDSVGNYNNSVACTWLTLKKSYEILDTAKLFYPDDINKILDQSKSDSLEIAVAVADGNGKCQPSGIYTRRQVDSIFAPLNILSVKRDSLIRIQENYSRIFADTNNSIRSYNEYLLQQNQKILAYNDSIQMVMFFCQKNPVMNTDTLKNRVDKIKSGDTLFIGAGMFKYAQLDFTNKGDSSNAIVIMGSPLMNTILDSMRIFVSNCYNIRFENLIIQNAGGIDGPNSGVKLEHNSQSVFFKNCVIKNNGLFGIESAESSLRLENCVITNNKEGGIRIDKGGISDVLLEGTDVIVANNSKYGIYSIRAKITLNYATISDNDFDGVYFNDPLTTSYFTNTIFSFNGRSGVCRDQTENINGIANFFSCNFYQNGQMDIDVKDAFKGENRDAKYVDPVFVDKGQNNYRISPSSSIYGLSIGCQYKK